MTAGMLELEAAFRLAESLALDFVELSADLHELAPALQEPARVRELRRHSGVGVTVHLSYVDLNLASLIPAARQTAVERTLRGLEFAHQVEAGCGVLHTGRHYLRHPLADQLVAEALSESLAALKGASVPVALENLVLDEDDYLRTPEELAQLTRQFDLANCLDFGHAHIESNAAGEARLERYLELLDDTLMHLHLHNNHGQRDEHLPTPEGSIDYRCYREFLATFNGTICLEISSEAGVGRSVAHLRAVVKGDG
ncbi:sugar phosphate isomerase/epimerase family protein [Truepera radiovictrix]|nr:sugar phosphate isomerase/epimerase family protein [Truepera radiovictrix]WMT58651.1 sugar phosphate isomerase/epimerase family protein [Truepera radiovictrix]